MIGLWFLTCVFLVTRPFHWYQNFWPCDLDLWDWPTLKKNFNQGYISLTIRAGALVFHMYIPHGQTYNFWPWLLTLTFDLLFEKHYPWLYLLHCKEQGFDISHADFFWWDLYFDTILLTLWPWLWILTYF